MMDFESTNGVEPITRALDLAERLRTAEHPGAILVTVAAMVQELSFHEGADLSFQVTDRLDTIRDHVRDRYEAVVVPDAYKRHWQAAQQELTQELAELEGELECVRSMPCGTEQERLLVLCAGFSVGISDASPRDVARDEERFLQWKQALEDFLGRRIAGTREIEERLSAHVSQGSAA